MNDRYQETKEKRKIILKRKVILFLSCFVCTILGFCFFVIQYNSQVTNYDLQEAAAVVNNFMSCRLNLNNNQSLTYTSAENVKELDRDDILNLIKKMGADGNTILEEYKEHIGFKIVDVKKYNNNSIVANIEIKTPYLPASNHEKFYEYLIRDFKNEDWMSYKIGYLPKKIAEVITRFWHFFESKDQKVSLYLHKHNGKWTISREVSV